MGAATATSGAVDRATDTPMSTAGAPEPIETGFSGAGTEVANDFRVERDGPTVLRLRHEAAGRFAVEVSDADGVQLDLLATHEGAWSGAYVLDLATGPCTLTAGAEGKWHATVLQHPAYGLGDVRTEWPVELTGSTPAVHGPVDLSADRTLSASVTGDGTTTVTVRDATGAIVAMPVYGTGGIEATKPVSVDADVGWLSVETSGEYRLTLEE